MGGENFTVAKAVFGKTQKTEWHLPCPESAMIKCSIKCSIKLTIVSNYIGNRENFLINATDGKFKLPNWVGQNCPTSHFSSVDNISKITSILYSITDNGQLNGTFYWTLYYGWLWTFCLLSSSKIHFYKCKDCHTQWRSLNFQTEWDNIVPDWTEV